jgi:murein tripeptide amidase MpaA
MLPAPAPQPEEVPNPTVTLRFSKEAHSRPNELAAEAGGSSVEQFVELVIEQALDSPSSVIEWICKKQHARLRSFDGHRLVAWCLENHLLRGRRFRPSIR